MRKNYFLSAALIALTGFGLVGCSDNPDRITNVNEVVKELVDFGGYTFVDKNANGIVDAGEALSGVRVTVKDPVTDKSYYAESDTNGRFDFSAPLTEGSYNVSFTDSAGTVNGAIVNSVEYFHAEHVIDLTQPGDGADGTPEQGAVSANFSMLAGPVMIATNFGDLAQPFDISSLTEITFTFNKPVTVVNDPRLVDVSNGNAQMALSSEGTSAASIKGSTILTSSRTTVSYKLPTLTKNHAFTLDWDRTDYKATDNGAFGPSVITAVVVGNAANAGTTPVDAANNAQTAAIVLSGRVAGNTANMLNSGTEVDIVSSTNGNVAVIDSVVVKAGQNPAGNTYSQGNSKYAIFAPQHRFTTTRAPYALAGTVSMMAQTYDIQLSNVKGDLEYTPIVSYDAGTTWYVAGATVQGSTANANGSITIPTNDLADVDGAGTTAPARPYYLVKGFYNTSTTDGENFTRLRVAIGRSGQGAAATPALTLGAPIRSNQYSATTVNKIDKRTERANDTWVNIFDGDLTDYLNRGFNRTNQTSVGGNVTNGIPGVADANYRGSSYPLPLAVDATHASIATVGHRNVWFGLVEDSSILTDLVEPDGTFRTSPVLAADIPASGSWVDSNDVVLSGIEEAASATINGDDNPNPALGTRAVYVHVYFNEPMDATTVQSTTNWRAHAGTSGATAPTVSKVEYSEVINTASGKEAFRAKVTLSAALVANQKLEYAAGALVDKNGNYPVFVDNTKPTSYITVFNN